MPTISISKETAESIYWALRQARNAPTNDAIRIEVYDKALREFEASRRQSPALDRAQGQWVPVEDGAFVPTVTDGTLHVYERNGTLGKAMVLQRGSFHGDIILEDGYALCRLTPAAEPVAQDERPRGDAGEA